MKTKKRRSMNLVATVFFILAAGFFLVNEKYSLIGQGEEGGGEFAIVSVVYDGDTVSAMIDGKREKIRLIGIDAPEMGQTPWGAESKRSLESILSSSGWKVRPEFDLERHDKYGRLLAYLWTRDGKLINLLMVRNGQAVLFTIPPNVKYADDLRAAQHEARNKKVGIWAGKILTERPVDYRRAHPRL